MLSVNLIRLGLGSTIIGIPSDMLADSLRYLLIVVGVVSAHAAFFFLQAATNVEDDIEKHALQQYGPWQGQDDLAVDFPWLKNVLREKISSIDWNEAADDVNSFLKPAEIESLKLWSERFFSAKLSTLG